VALKEFGARLIACRPSRVFRRKKLFRSNPFRFTIPL